MGEYKKREQSYPSDLTDEQWAEIEPLFSGMREYRWPKRELVDAVLYFVKAIPYETKTAQCGIMVI